MVAIVTPAAAPGTDPSDRSGRLLIAGGGFVLAFLARLLPMLRGGGLAGYGSYDDAVYYASAVGLVHGRLPYRDFLLLQPPGIVLALTPFAALGRVIGETPGFAVSRLGWMTMGGLTTVGIVVLLYPLGRVAAAVGAAFYALFWPSALVERVTDLEAPQSLLLVVALLLLRPLDERAVRGAAPAVTAALPGFLAGLALGFAVGVKVSSFGVVAVLAVWLLWQRRVRQLVAFLVGAVVAGAAVYLPFFIAAPEPMWRMVVLDQLGRRRMGGWLERLAMISGTTALPGPRALLVLAAVVAAVVMVVLAWRVRSLRPVVWIFLVLVAGLLAAPGRFIHYGALVGPPAAILLGGAVAELLRLGRRLPAGRTFGWLVTALVVLALVVMAYPIATHRYEHRMDAARIRPVVDRARGCITFDSPSPALSLGIVGRNLDRGCRLVVDLGGAGYEPNLRADRPRARNAAWQRYAVDYLGSGELTIGYRFRTHFGYSPHTSRIIRSWPVVARAGAVRVRRPTR